MPAKKQKRTGREIQPYKPRVNHIPPKSPVNYIIKKEGTLVRNVIIIILALIIIGGGMWTVGRNNKPTKVIPSPVEVIRTVLVIQTATPLPTPTSTPRPNRVSEDGKSFIKFFEGKSLVAYFDAAKHCTIGIGHMTDDIWCYGELKTTDLQADKWFAEDIQNTERYLAIELGGINLIQCQFDALADFEFNLGNYYFEVSGIKNALLKNDYMGVVDIFGMYTYANGIQIDGLVIRRAADAKLFQECVYQS
jgi:lysozyme